MDKAYVLSRIRIVENRRGKKKGKNDIILFETQDKMVTLQLL